MFSQTEAAAFGGAPMRAPPKLKPNCERCNQAFNLRSCARRSFGSRCTIWAMGTFGLKANSGRRCQKALSRLNMPMPLMLDTPQGAFLRMVRTIAHLLRRFDQAESPAMYIGFLLAMDVAQTAAQIEREFIDGPALARERNAMECRAEGGRARATQLREGSKRKDARNAFEIAKRNNPRLTANGWAAIQADKFGVKQDTLARWVRSKR
jgi:hypothetical protein